MLKTLKIFALVALIAYTLLCAAVVLVPEYIFYGAYDYPADINQARKNGFNAKEVTYFDYGKNGGKVMGWLYLNKTLQNNGKAIIFLHGNSYNLEHYYHKMIPLAKAGYSVLMPEYRGFGGQGKKIKQQYLEQDAVNAVKYLNKLGFSNDKIIIYGISLGSYTALYAAENQQHNGNFNAVILEVPFTSLLEAAESYVTFGAIKLVPLDLLMKDTYNNLALIGKIKTRILIMATKDDEVIPPALAEKLYRQANEPKKMIIYEGAPHDGLFSLHNYRDILEWL